MSSVSPINKGLQVLENGTNLLSGVFLRWLQTIESNINKAVLKNDNGSIKFGDTEIPEDVDQTCIYHFYNSGSNRTIQADGTIEDCFGCYLTSTFITYKSLINGNISVISQQPDGSYRHYKKIGATAGSTYNIAIDFTVTLIA